MTKNRPEDSDASRPIAESLVRKKQNKNKKKHGEKRTFWARNYVNLWRGQEVIRTTIIKTQVQELVQDWCVWMDTSVKAQKTHVGKQLCENVPSLCTNVAMSSTRCVRLTECA